MDQRELKLKIIKGVLGNNLFKFAEKDLEWNGERWEYNGNNEFVVTALTISKKRSDRAKKKKLKARQPKKPKYKI